MFCFVNLWIATPTHSIRAMHLLYAACESEKVILYDGLVSSLALALVGLVRIVLAIGSSKWVNELRLIEYQVSDISEQVAVCRFFQFNLIPIQEQSC